MAYNADGADMPHVQRKPSELKVTQVSPHGEPDKRSPNALAKTWLGIDNIMPADVDAKHTPWPDKSVFDYLLPPTSGTMLACTPGHDDSIVVAASGTLLCPDSCHPFAS